MNEHDTIDLVLEGGGAKGVGLVGAVARILQDREVARVAGTSAGAIVAGLVAAGYSGTDLDKAMRKFPFRRIPHRMKLKQTRLTRSILACSVRPYPPM